MDNEQAQNLECWAILDLFGHQKIAGKLTTQTLGVAALIRIDVPEVTIPEKKESSYDYVTGKYVERLIPAHKKGGYTRYFGLGAIYSISPVTEELARAAVVRIDAEPVKAYELPERPALTEGSAQPSLVSGQETEQEIDGEDIDEETDDTLLCNKCGGELEESTDPAVLQCADCGTTVPKQGTEG